MALNFQSGTEGKVLFDSSEYLAAHAWEFTETADTWSGGVFGGGGNKRAKAGQKQKRGTVRVKYDEDTPLEDKLGAGSSIALALYYDRTNSRGWSGTAIVESVRYGLDGEGEGILEAEVTWVSTGAWTDPSHS